MFHAIIRYFQNNNYGCYNYYEISHILIFNIIVSKINCLHTLELFQFFPLSMNHTCL